MVLSKCTEVSPVVHHNTGQWPTKFQHIYLKKSLCATGCPCCCLQERKQLTFEFIDGVLTIRKPVAYLMMDWVITIA